MPTMDQLIVWIIVGLVGGGLAGRLATWDSAGLGIARNLGLGLAGALVGGALFWLFGLFPALDRVVVSLRDVVSALVGSLIVLAGLWLWNYFRPARTP
jgi:uncharacterized membrane protein YeaQ/YmgE (transglycosylase-associated protein family)